MGLSDTPDTGIVPVPVSWTIRGLLGSLSIICNDADSAAAVVGVKMTLTMQFAPAVRVPVVVLVEPQVFVSEKSAALKPVTEMAMPVSEFAPLLVIVTD